MFASFLRKSLALLSRDVPPLYAALAAQLDGGVLIVVAGEKVYLTGAGGSVAWEPLLNPAVHVCTSHQGILDIIDGETSLIDAILSERLRLWGAPSALARFDEALRLYVNGAVRSPAMTGLLRTYRAEVGDGER